MTSKLRKIPRLGGGSAFDNSQLDTEEPIAKRNSWGRSHALDKAAGKMAKLKTSTSMFSGLGGKRERTPPARMASVATGLSSVAESVPLAPMVPAAGEENSPITRTASQLTSATRASSRQTLTRADGDVPSGYMKEELKRLWTELQELQQAYKNLSVEQKNLREEVRKGQTGMQRSLNVEMAGKISGKAPVYKSGGDPDGDGEGSKRPSVTAKASPAVEETTLLGGIWEACGLGFGGKAALQDAEPQETSSPSSPPPGRRLSSNGHGRSASARPRDRAPAQALPAPPTFTSSDLPRAQANAREAPMEGRSKSASSSRRSGVSQVVEGSADVPRFGVGELPSAPSFSSTKYDGAVSHSSEISKRSDVPAVADASVKLDDTQLHGAGTEQTFPEGNEVPRFGKDDGDRRKAASPPVASHENSPMRTPVASSPVASSPVDQKEKSVSWKAPQAGQPLLLPFPDADDDSDDDADFAPSLSASQSTTLSPVPAFKKGTFENLGHTMQQPEVEAQ